MKSTIFEALSSFQAVNPKANKQTVRSVMHRFLAEHWEGEAPKGNKATFEEVNAFTNLIKALPSSKLIGTLEVLEQEFINKEIPKGNIKSYKCAYKGFLEWCQDNGYLKKVEEKEKTVVLETTLFSRFKDAVVEGQSIIPKQIKKPAYALMSTHGSFGKKNGQLIYPNDYINPELMNERSLFINFRKEYHSCVSRTTSVDLRRIDQFLGWLYRFKGISLEDLRLTSIIHFIKLNRSTKDFKNKQGKINFKKYQDKKVEARQETVDIANENILLIKEYLDFVGGQASTRSSILVTCIAVAKFVFRDEIGNDEYIDESELPIIKRLNKLSTPLIKTAKDAPAVVPHEHKSVSWNKAISVLEIARKRADCSSYNRKGNYISKAGSINMTIINRRKTAVINDTQKFLSLAFMLLIPTDRARTYYELEIGRTFVYGLLKEGRFISVEKLEDKNQAIWYIHLLPSDYKTGKTYKEYWGVMPNVMFEDGQKLYDYINIWINDYREYRQKCNHNCFFRGKRDYQPLSSSGWCDHIKRIFRSTTGVPVTPKEIRKMYVTHINNQGATYAELKGAWTAMHQSQKMQDSVYNCQTAFEKVAPITKLNERVWKETFGKDHFGSFEED